MRTLAACLLIVGLIVVDSPSARAGMPALLPVNPKKYLEPNEWSRDRFDGISFFLVAFLASAFLVKLLWNYLRRDFPSLPRLGYGRALAGVFLWGLLFVIVLTMISGARELMTPGAWKKQGFTYKLADAPDPSHDPSPATLRRQHLEQLRQALRHFAATHQGHSPSAGARTQIPAA